MLKLHIMPTAQNSMIDYNTKSQIIKEITSRPNYLSLNVIRENKSEYLPFKINYEDQFKDLPLNIIREDKPKILSLNIIRENKPKKRSVYRLTLQIVLERSKIIHGDKYDYSLVMESHIKGHKSHIPLICYRCGFHWNPTISDHIYAKSGCPECAGQINWTLERFLEKAIIIHGDKYKYSLITKYHIDGHKSHIPIICRTCKYIWNPTISDHIHAKSGCPGCYGNIPWTLERFLYKAVIIHQNKYNYSQITVAHINGVDSHIPIICRTCNYNWSPTLGQHINREAGCPNCYGNVPWTLERFLIKANEIHGDKYDYSQLNETHFNGTRSHIPLKCNTCKYTWNPTITTHINRSGCPNCSGHAPWTYERFINKACVIHNNKYNYSQIAKDQIKTNNSEISIICIKCNHNWISTIHSHIYQRSGCPKCYNGGFSSAQINWLEYTCVSEGIKIQHALSINGEYRIQGVGKVDGFCSETNTVYEFHGDFWHGNPNKFNSEDINPVSGEKYGDLYRATIARDNKIKELGYNLIVRWESNCPQYPY